MEQLNAFTFQISQNILTKYDPAESYDLSNLLRRCIEFYFFPSLLGHTSRLRSLLLVCFSVEKPAPGLPFHSFRKDKSLLNCNLFSLFTLQRSKRRYLNYFYHNLMKHLLYFKLTIRLNDI